MFSDMKLGGKKHLAALSVRANGALDQHRTKSHLDMFLENTLFFFFCFSGPQCRCASQRYDGSPDIVLYVDLCSHAAAAPHT